MQNFKCLMPETKKYRLKKKFQGGFFPMENITKINIFFKMAMTSLKIFKMPWLC